MSLVLTLVYVLYVEIYYKMPNMYMTFITPATDVDIGIVSHIHHHQPL